jgi:hypothetical protein
MKKYFFLLTATLFAQIITAQSGTISGRVNDSVSGESVPYAHVMVVNEADSANISMGVTDEKGNYRVDGLPYGDYSVKVSCLGYKTKHTNGITLSSEQKRLNLDIPINIDIAALEGAVITADRPSVEFRPDKKVVHIDLTATGGGESVADFLKSVPEIRVDGDQVTLKTFAPTILVNGKPASAAMSDLINLPASLISSVEVITNPSVRYNPEGLGGIINLKTRRMAEGINGMVQASVGSNKTFNGAGTLNYRTKKWNLFANIFDRYGDGLLTGTLNQQFESGQSLVQTLESSQMLNRISTRIGTDFEPDSVNAFTLYWEFSKRIGTIESNNAWDEKGLLMDRTYASEQLMNLDSRDNSIGFNYSHTFKNESELEIDISQFFGYEPSKSNLLSNEIEYLNYHNEFFYNTNVSDVNINYTSTLFGIYDLETGVSFNREQTEVGDSLSGNFQTDYNHVFDLNREISAGYVSLGKSFGSFGLSAGLRGEYVNQSLNSVDFKSNNAYFSLFPNAGISYRVNDKTSMNLNYGRRVWRPGIFNLTPYASIFDEYPSQRLIGNPNLKPAYTNSIDFGGAFNGSKYAISSSISYMRTENDIADVYYSDGSLTYSTKQNIATSQKLLFNTTFDWHSRIFKIYRPYLSFRLGQDFYDTPDATTGENIHKSFFNYHINLYNLFYLSETFFITIDATYYPQTYKYASIINDYFDLSLTVRKRFKNNLTLQISANNILNSNPATTSHGEGFVSIINANPHTQAIFLGIFYRFGKPIRTRAQVDLNLNRIEAQ